MTCLNAILILSGITDSPLPTLQGIFADNLVNISRVSGNLWRLKEIFRSLKQGISFSDILGNLSTLLDGDTNFL